MTMKVIALVALGVAAIYALHRLAIWAEDRGWIYYRKGHGRSSSASSAISELQSLFHPASQHAIEERHRIELTRDQPGDDSDD